MIMAMAMATMTMTMMGIMVLWIVVFVVVDIVGAAAVVVAVSLLYHVFGAQPSPSPFTIFPNPVLKFMTALCLSESPSINISLSPPLPLYFWNQTAPGTESPPVQLLGRNFRGPADVLHVVLWRPEHQHCYRGETRIMRAYNTC